MTAQETKDTLTMGAGKGADETTAATEPVRRPGPLPSKKLDELIEYMEACALIARNGADIHSRSKELRHHADMVTAVVESLRASHEPPAELWGDGTREMLIELRDWMRAKMPCNAGACCSELRGWIEKVDKHITHHAPAELAAGIEWLKQEICDGEEYLQRYPNSVDELAQQEHRQRLLDAITGSAQPPIDARVHPDTRLIDSLRMRSTLNDMAARADSAKRSCWLHGTDPDPDCNDCSSRMDVCADCKQP